MNWVFDGMPVQDIARGIYISIANKVAKMKLVPGLPIYIIGGVIAYHPYLNTILSVKFGRDITMVDHPQYTVSYGAAIIAKQSWAGQGNEAMLVATETMKEH